MRRALGALIAVAALAGAAASQRKVEESWAAEARAAAEQAASLARQHAADALRSHLREIESRAVTAAALPQLRAQLTRLRDDALEGALARTLEDWLETEPEWEPFRREFGVYGVSVEGGAMGILHGLKTQELASERLILESRDSDKGLGSAVVMGGGWPHAAAAARVTVATRKTPPVVLLAKPLDEASLKPVADRAGGAVLLSTGEKVLVGQGAKEELGRLETVVGKEAEGVPYVAPKGTWAAGANAVVPGLWLWVHAGAEASAQEAESAATTTQVIIWSAGALISVLALFFGLRRPASSIPVSAAAPASSPTFRIETPVETPSAAAASGAPAGGPGSTRGAGLPTAAPPAADATTPEPNVALGSTLAMAGPPAPPPPSSHGRQFGRYTLVDKLGEGGMARVYTAVIYGAEGFRRKFVVKRLRPELVNDAAVVAQFIDEANMASSLVHSNIIPVLDFGKVGDEYFLATEYILGRDLGRIVQKCQQVDGRAMAVGPVLFAAHETLKALEYAHTKAGEGGRALGIVHRDVSPNNVLVSARGEVKLFDFGIVKAEGRVTRTQHGVVKGNVSFMSPEQARGVAVDARADLFSLGLVMYYCLTGDVLYQGNTSYELLLKAATGPGPEEIARIQALPAPADGLVARALTVDPAARFQSAAEFAAAVAPHVGRGSGEMAELMARAFADELRQEEVRLSGAIPSVGAANAVAPGRPSNTTVRGS
jgi:hypothetical protein